MNGIGIRFAVANWIQAAWAVAFVRCYTCLRLTDEADPRPCSCGLSPRCSSSSTSSTCTSPSIVYRSVSRELNSSLSIHLTLLKYPPTLSRPLDTVLIHAPTTLLLAILFELDWLHNGFIALGWVTETRKDWGRHTWQAVIGIAAVNVIVALWAGFRRQ